MFYLKLAKTGHTVNGYLRNEQHNKFEIFSADMNESRLKY